MFTLFEETIDKLERVSEYFSYTEEYLLSRHFLFLRRKFEHYDRSQYEKRRYAQADIFNALYAQLDVKATGGKNVVEILLPEYEEQKKRDSDPRHLPKPKGDGKGKTQSSILFKPNDFDPYAFMSPEQKAGLEKNYS